MTVDERTLRESLSTYANGVVTTSSDMDRMHTDLQQRLGPKRKARGPGCSSPPPRSCS